MVELVVFAVGLAITGWLLRKVVTGRLRWGRSNGVGRINFKGGDVPWRMKVK